MIDKSKKTADSIVKFDSVVKLKKEMVNHTKTTDRAYQMKQNKNNQLIQDAIHWALVNGFVVVPKSLTASDEMCITYMPFTLYPTPYCRKHFETVTTLQPTVNEITYKIAKSESFMKNIFQKYLLLIIFYLQDHLLKSISLK